MSRRRTKVIRRGARSTGMPRALPYIGNGQGAGRRKGRRLSDLGAQGRSVVDDKERRGDSVWQRAG